MVFQHIDTGGDLEVVHEKEQNLPPHTNNNDKPEVGIVTPQVNKTSEEKIIKASKPNGTVSSTVTTLTPTTKPIPSLAKPFENKNKNAIIKPTETEKVSTDL